MASISTKNQESGSEQGSRRSSKSNKEHESKSKSAKKQSSQIPSEIDDKPGAVENNDRDPLDMTLHEFAENYGISLLDVIPKMKSISEMDSEHAAIYYHQNHVALAKHALVEYNHKMMNTMYELEQVKKAKKKVSKYLHQDGVLDPNNADSKTFKGVVSFPNGSICVETCVQEGEEVVEWDYEQGSAIFAVKTRPRLGLKNKSASKEFEEE